MKGTVYWAIRVLPAADVLLQAAILVAVFSKQLIDGWIVQLCCLLIIPLSQHLLRAFGTYDSHRMEGAREVIRKILTAQLIAFSVFFSVTVAAPIQGVTLSGIEFFAATAGTLALERLILYRILRSVRRHGYDRRKVCIIGSQADALRFSEKFHDRPDWGLEIVCVGSGNPESRTFSSFPDGRGLPQEFESLLKQCVIDEVLIVASPERVQVESQAARLYEQYGLLVRVVLQPEFAGSQQRLMEQFFGSAAMSTVPRLHSEGAMAVKRVFDVAVATVLLVLTAPLMTIIAALVKLSSPGPVFFRQVRVGMNGRRFRIIKFRTMVDGAEAMIRHSHKSVTQGPIFKDPNDYRVTSLGRYLRRFSLDELPQLINVLKGEMSVVGPRPLPAYEADQITGQSRRRFSVPPGITCLWQISGRSDVNYETWMNYDLQYVDQWSIWSDTVLLFRTISAVLSRKGAY